MVVVLTTLIILVLISLWIWYVSQPTGKLNEPCYRKSDCRAGLVCTEGKCLKISGGQCRRNSDCSTGHCDSGICRSKRKTLGEPCVFQLDCGSGLTCERGICKSKIGGYCQGIGDCAAPSTLCINDICQTGTVDSPIVGSLRLVDITSAQQINSNTHQQSSNQSGNTQSLQTIITGIKSAVIIDDRLYALKDKTIMIYRFDKPISINESKINAQIIGSPFPTQLVRVGRYLYALVADRLYRVQKDGNFIRLIPINIDPLDDQDLTREIIDISSSYDGKSVWIQKSEGGYLVSPNFDTMIATIPFSVSLRRRYGPTREYYVDIDRINGTATVVTNDMKRQINDVSWVGFNSSGDVFNFQKKDKVQWFGEVVGRKFVIRP